MTENGGRGSSGKVWLLLLDARSILRKIQCTRLFTLSSNFDFMLTTKTWLNNSNPDDSMAIPGYEAFRASHEVQRKVGCLVYVSESIPNTLCQDTMLTTVQLPFVLELR